MSLVNLLLILLVALVVMVIAERLLYRRRKKKNAEAGTETEIESPVHTTMNRAWGTVQHVGTNARETTRTLLTPEYVKLAPDFRQWIETEISDDKLRAWLLSLPDENFNALTGQVIFFCTDLNVNFKWLLNGLIDLQPKSRQVVTDIITKYCQACLEAVQIQDDLARLNDYQVTLNYLEKGNQVEFGQRLLKDLREANLAEPAPPRILLATESERRQYALETIHEAAKQDREKFTEIWTSVSANKRRA